MRQKTQNIQRDQFALAVGVERIVEMLSIDAFGGDGPVEVRIEHGPVEGWDDVVEWRRHGTRLEEHRWQAKDQSTPLEKAVFVDLMRALRDAPGVDGHLCLRDMVEIADMGELRHLRLLCRRARAGADAPGLMQQANGPERRWLSDLEAELELDGAGVVRLLARLDIVTADPDGLRQASVKGLRPIYGDRAEHVAAAIHDRVAQHPDGAIGYTAQVIRERVPGAALVGVLVIPVTVPAAWTSHGLAEASQRAWWTKLQRLVDAISSEPRVAPHLPTEAPVPGDPTFLWRWDQPPLDIVEHGRQALLAIRYFSRHDLPARVGDFAPATHPLRQVRLGDAWTEKAWPDRRRELVEAYVEPLVAWAMAVRDRPSPPADPLADFHRTPPARVVELAHRLYGVGDYVEVINTRFTLGIDDDAEWTSLIESYWVADDSRFVGLTAPAWATSPYSDDVQAVIAEAIRVAQDWCKRDRRLFSLPWSDFTMPQRSRPWFCLRVLGAFGIARLGVRRDLRHAGDVPDDTEIKLEVVDERMMKLARCKTVEDVWRWRCEIAGTGRPPSAWVG